MKTRSSTSFLQMDFERDDWFLCIAAIQWWGACRGGPLSPPSGGSLGLKGYLRGEGLRRTLQGVTSVAEATQKPDNSIVSQLFPCSKARAGCLPRLDVCTIDLISKYGTERLHRLHGRLYRLHRRSPGWGAPPHPAAHGTVRALTQSPTRGAVSCYQYCTEYGREGNFCPPCAQVEQDQSSVL